VCSRPICLITGANSGIGKAAALKYAQAGAKLILACRDEVRGKKALEEIHGNLGDVPVELMLVDLSSMSSIIHFTRQFNNQFSHLNVLVHNAANFDHSLTKATLTEDGFETIFATNFLGPFLMTHTLMPALKNAENARVITIGSKGLNYYPFTDLDLNDLNMQKKKFSTAKAYYNSKLATVMFTLELADRFQTDLTANCVQVTNVRISDERIRYLPWHYRLAYAIKRKFSITPEEMANTYSYLGLSKEVQGKTGLYFDEKQNIVPFLKIATDLDKRRKLWEISAKMLEPWMCELS